MAIVLGANQFGKAEVRMVYVDRNTPVHEITDVNVTSQLIGDFAETHLTGANDAVIATDTQKNTVYAMARTGGFGSPEEFALRLARNYVSKYEQVTGARMAVEQYSWDRITTTGGPHDHAFSKGTAEARTTVVRKDGDAEIVISGLTGLVVLKSTGSEFWGFPDVEHLAGGNHRPHPGHCGDRPLALHDQRYRVGQGLQRRADGAIGGVRRHSQLVPAADAVRDGQGRTGGGT